MEKQIAIAALERLKDGTSGIVAATISDCQRVIGDLPDATGWIPVTERLPKCGERVLATDGGFVGEFYINKCGQWQRYNVNDYSLLMALDVLFLDSHAGTAEGGCLMQRCSEKAFAMCPTRHLCGSIEDAAFTDHSECAVFNKSVEDKPMTLADKIRHMDDSDLAELLVKYFLGGVTAMTDRETEADVKDVLVDVMLGFIQQPSEGGVGP